MHANEIMRINTRFSDGSTLEKQQTQAFNNNRHYRKNFENEDNKLLSSHKRQQHHHQLEKAMYDTDQSLA